jgi:membrane protein
VKPILTTAGLFRRAFEQCLKDNTPVHAAAIAFYTLLSLAPSLLVIVAIIGTWFGRESAKVEVVAAVAAFTNASTATMIAGLLDKLESSSSAATIAGLASMFFGATVAFGALQTALNTIWNIPPRNVGWVRDFVVKRLVSFAFVLLSGAMLLASVVSGAVLTAAARMFPSELPASQFLLQAITFVVSTALVTLMFGIIYKVLPDVWIRWSDVWLGAGVTALLFSLGKTLIGLYLGHTGTGSAYGAAGSLVLFLLWVYYSAQIFLFGAEFTEVCAEARGASIRPRRFAKANQSARTLPSEP